MVFLKEDLEADSALGQEASPVSSETAGFCEVHFWAEAPGLLDVTCDPVRAYGLWS